ncbi:MAG TPA: fatty acid desaturase [Candidatus Binataceae bacterium]|nr:fatty acid desaturase [Candidatus Binataceae bacterium]
MSSILKENRRDIILRHARSDDVSGLTQVVITLGCLALVWWATVLSAKISLWLTVPSIILISLFTLRVFALMHECGHASLFRNQRLNRAFGFVLGVIAGMPQYVWSQHHSYHHANNGNWEKYRGPYTTLSVTEYEALTSTRRIIYRGKCSIVFTPFVGFIYLIFNPRFTWLKGSLSLLFHICRNKLAQPHLTMIAHLAGFKSPYWKSRKQYWHMFSNNLVLLTGWILMSWTMGTARFFAIYLISLSIAGGVGIMLFTVQHNFEHSYASHTRGWDYETAVIEGTSFLLLPRWLNWFTANIGYHHIHHLSARIPNYRLIACHNEHRDMFSDVTRITLSGVPKALKYILWDERAQRIISIAEYRRLTGNRVWPEDIAATV